MAIDKRLQIYDEQGNLVDYDILASDVKFLPDGKDLPTKLAELEDDIDAAGSGDGTVTGVKIGSTTYEPTDGVVDLSSPMGNKVDKNGTDSLMTAAEHTKLGNLPTATELATQMNAKANDNAVVKTISVNGGQAQTPTNGNVNISVEGAAGENGVTPHIGSNGNWWIGPETDPTNDTNIKAQGPMGSVTITDGDIDTLEVHNALNAYTGLLGMSGAMMIKDNIDSLYASLNRLYGKLANMAFWDSTDQSAAAPTALDWSLPKHSVAITNNLANSSITRNGESVGSSFQAEEGSTVTLIVAPSGSSYALTNVTYSKDSGSPTNATSLGDGTYKIEFVMGDSDVTISVSGTVVESVAVSLSNTDGKLELSPLTCVKNGTYSGTLAVKSGETDYGLPSTISATIGGVAVDFTASGNSYDPSDGSITIANVSGALVITAAATYSGWLTVPKNDVTEGGSVVMYGMQQGRSIDTNKGNLGASNSSGQALAVCMPAGYPYNVKYFGTNAAGGSENIQSNPGKLSSCYLAASGKKYINIRITGQAAGTGYAYVVSLGCYGNAVINNTQNDSLNNTATLIDGFIGRWKTNAGFDVGNVDAMQWKINLHEFATEKGASAGDITYIKLFVGLRNTNTNSLTASDGFYNDITVEYKFTDD